MFVLTQPPQSYKTDATFFDEGIRLSSDFINKENLRDFKSVWIFIDSENKKLGFKFHPDFSPQAIKISNGSSKTSNKVIWCSYLKKFPFVKVTMDDKDINKRRFPIKRLVNLGEKSNEIEYEIDLFDH